MVLSHTTGFPNWRPPGEPIKVHFAPGSRYSLSGEGLTLLQRVVEHVTGQPVEAFMQATVLRPLGMTRTTYARPAANTADVATAYGRDNAPITPPADEEPNVAHTIRTTAADYARFLVAVMRGEGLRPETHRELMRVQTSTDICRSGAVSWGLGFALEPSPLGDGFVAWGKSPDANAYLFGVAERGDAVFYLTNTAAHGMKIGQKVVKLVFGRDDPLLGCFGVRSYDAAAR
jgi:CubicO group peptidase (beta-lactamase class C family)